MIEVREDLRRAHINAWARLAKPGAWLTSAEKCAIAVEARAALNCPACAERNAALSPEQPTQLHVSESHLDASWVDLIHRIRTDADRLTPTWFARVVPAVLTVEQYVEVVGVIAEVTAVDSFHTAMGMSLLPLPTPGAGMPTGSKSSAAKLAGAWVPTVAPEDVTMNDPEPVQAMYRNRSAANIHRALSLIPEAVNGFFELDDAMYLPDALLRRFDEEPRAITHAQIELLAARVSALNRCLY